MPPWPQHCRRTDDDSIHARASCWPNPSACARAPASPTPSSRRSGATSASNHADRCRPLRVASRRHLRCRRGRSRSRRASPRCPTCRGQASRQPRADSTPGSQSSSNGIGTGRDLLDGSGSSHLGADLHFGTLSPLQVESAASAIGPDSEPFTRQLAWRELYHHHLRHLGSSVGFPRSSSARSGQRPMTLPG